MNGLRRGVERSHGDRRRVKRTVPINRSRLLAHAAMKRPVRSRSWARGGAAPQTGFGQPRRSRRAMTWTCSCGTDIAERRDIELVAGGDAFSARATRVDLGHQLRLLDLVEIDDFDDVRPPRHQQQPRIIGVVDRPARATAAGRRASMVSRASCGCSDQLAAMAISVQENRWPGKASIGAARGACIPVPFRRYRKREVGGGRATRQPGQVRKEAALTSSGSGRSSASHSFIHAMPSRVDRASRESDRMTR